mmetsp:Transcript_48512/g.113563  ORF Transcript_48512/g.113563 Transcript_48512/m.113563 type:complete len:205 (-) Transcript_48512:1465-2079(-)
MERAFHPEPASAQLAREHLVPRWRADPQALPSLRQAPVLLEVRGQVWALQALHLVAYPDPLQQPWLLASASASPEFAQGCKQAVGQQLQVPCSQLQLMVHPCQCQRKLEASCTPMGLVLASHGPLALGACLVCPSVVAALPPWVLQQDVGKACHKAWACLAEAVLEMEQPCRHLFPLCPCLLPRVHPFYPNHHVQRAFASPCSR